MPADESAKNVSNIALASPPRSTNSYSLELRERLSHFAEN
jgi:hypothetical protein